MRRGLLILYRTDDVRYRWFYRRGYYVHLQCNSRRGLRISQKTDLLITLDDITHIDFLEEVAGLPETISCRFNPGGDFVIDNAIMDTPQAAKYGFTREQMTDGSKILKSKGVKHFGIHAFLASNTIVNEYYPVSGAIFFQTAMVTSGNRRHIAFINLSGGVGILYLPDQQPTDIYEVGRGVQKAFEEILVPAGMGDIAIYTELGRFVLGPFGHSGYHRPA